MNTAFRDIVWQVATKGIRFPLQFAIATLLARSLGPGGVGQWAMVLAAGMAMTPLLMWTQVAAVRFGKEEWLAHGSIGKTWQGRRPLLLSGTIAAGFLVWANPFGWLERVYGLTGMLAVASLAALVGAWCMGETQVGGQIRGDLRRFSTYQVFADLVLLAIAMLLNTLDWGVNGQSAGILVLTLGVAMLWVGAWGGELKRLRVGAATSPQRSAGPIARYSWPLLLGALIAYSADWGNQLLLKFFFDVREVGLFQMAYQFMAALWGGSALLSVVATPRLIARHIAAPDDTASWFVNQFFPTVAILWLLGVIPLLVLAPLAFEFLVGNNFREAIVPFTILCATVPGAVISGLLGSMYNLEGRLFKSAVVFATVVSGTGLAISLVLIPSHGVRGAAIGTAVAYLVGQALLLLDQSARHGTRRYRLVLIYAVAALFSGLQALPTMSWSIRIVLGVATYLIVIWTSRALALVDGRVVSSLLPAPLAPVGRFLCRLLSTAKPPKWI